MIYSKVKNLFIYHGILFQLPNLTILAILVIDLDDGMSHSFTCSIMAQLPLSLVNRFQGVGKDSNFVKLFSLVFKHVSDYSPPNDDGSEPVLFCRQFR